MTLIYEIKIKGNNNMYIKIKTKIPIIAIEMIKLIIKNKIILMTKKRSLILLWKNFIILFIIIF